MNEKEFRARYARAQGSIKASPEQRARVLALAQERPARRQRPDAPSARRSGKPTLRWENRRAGVFPLLSRRRWLAPAAACLLAAVLIAAGTPLLLLRFQGSPEAPLTAEEAAEQSGFSVKAYAADGSAPLSFGQGGMVVFDRDLGQSFPGGDDYKTTGFFTGCLFHVEGQGIKRVQANLSSGALYRVSFVDQPAPGSPQSRELSGWKPTSRGTGEYYGGYDFVTNSSKGKLGLAKLIGSTIDLSASEDPGIADGTTKFGLWTNEGDAPDSIVVDDPQSPLIDLFDGQKLTVTVTFEDDSTSTQVIELHAANFKAEKDQGFLKLTTQLASSDDDNGGGDSIAVKSLYGTVMKASSEPFPLPLDHANDRADTVLPASMLSRLDDTERVSFSRDGENVDAKLPPEGLVAPDASLDFDYNYADSSEDANKHARMRMSKPRLTLSDSLPAGKTLADCSVVDQGWLGDAAYMDKCSREVWGYGYNADGTLTDPDYRFVTTTTTVTNLEDRPVNLRGETAYEFVLRHDDGSLDSVRTGYGLDVEATGDVQPSGDSPHLSIAPGGTVQLSVLRVLPASVLKDKGLVLVPHDSSKPYAQAFALGAQL